MKTALAAGAVQWVGSLARVGNITTDRMRRLLRANGVDLLRIGRVLAVSLADLKRQLPWLWESLVLMETLRVRASRAREPQG